MTNLTSLNLRAFNLPIDNSGIRNLTNLCELLFEGNMYIDDAGIQNFPFLTHLKVNRNITNEGIKYLSLLSSRV